MDTSTREGAMALRVTETVWREAHTGGFVAEIRGLLNPATACYEWIRLGVYGTREAAVEAVIAAR